MVNRNISAGLRQMAKTAGIDGSWSTTAIQKVAILRADSRWSKSEAQLSINDYLEPDALSKAFSTLGSSYTARSAKDMNNHTGRFSSEYIPERDGLRDGLSGALSYSGGRRAGKSKFFEEVEQRRLHTVAKEKELDRAEFLASPIANSW